MPASALRSVVSAMILWAQMASFCLLPHFTNWRPTIVPLQFVLGLVTPKG